MDLTLRKDRGHIFIFNYWHYLPTEIVSFLIPRWKTLSYAHNLKEFFKINIAEVENPAGDLVGGFILGSSDFVNWVKTETGLEVNIEK